MKLIISFLLISFSTFVLCEEKKETRSVKELVDIGVAFGTLAVSTVDATVGEIFVRAYPSKLIAEQSFGENRHVELSCDTFRTGAANHYIASANQCHIVFSLKAKKGKYTLEGPFTNEDLFKGNSCEEARKTCENFKVELQEQIDTVAIKSGGNILGKIDFTNLTPSYMMNEK